MIFDFSISIKLQSKFLHSNHLIFIISSSFFLLFVPSAAFTYPLSTMTRLPNQTAVERKKLPSRGGTPYSQDTRRKILRNFISGLEESEEHLEDQREHGVHPSDRTIRCWSQQFEDRRHVRPFRATGNKRATVLKGNDLVYLGIYRTIFPKATVAEINAFIGNMNFGNPHQRFYSPSQIGRAEEELGLSRKVGSTTAYQAFLPINIARRHDYWNRPYPFGMADIHCQDIIYDIDEAAGVFVEIADRKYGKCEIGRRVKQAGPYSKSYKLNIIMVVSGDPVGHRWYYTLDQGSTTNDLFVEFIEHLMNLLPHGNEGRRYCITMDNLNAHWNPQVLALIADHGHRVCFRAPYYPIEGAIEYMFNTLQTRLRLRMP